jgi:hypothetical protein
VAHRNDTGFTDRLQGPFSAVYMSVKPTRFLLILPLPAGPTSLYLSFETSANRMVPFYNQITQQTFSS